MALTLSNLTYDHSDFVEQFENYLQTQPVWKGNLTTQTSQTLIELVAAVGTYDQQTLLRASEDAYSETGQSDDAILAITQMQGLRITRKAPTSLSVSLTYSATSGTSITIPSYTQFTCSGLYWFNRTAITLQSGVAQSATLYQGQVFTKQMSGLGTDLQAYICPETAFNVSDTDTQVSINGAIIQRAIGGLWNYKGVPAFADLTLNDGRFIAQFGNANFGSLPGVNDTVLVTYAVTLGSDAINTSTSGNGVSIDGYSAISGTASENPQGGSTTKSILAYKNLAAGAFGTYDSAVTGNQYKATVGTYPGILDAITQAQREINPMAKEWMNVIRVSAITETTWTQTQKNDFITAMQSVSMYAPRFVWQDAIAVLRDVVIDVYCYNTATLSDVKAAVQAAITTLFAPKPGVLLRNLYSYDLELAARSAAPGLVSYVKVIAPVYDMTVSAPASPAMSYTIQNTGGSLTELVYAYAVSTINTAGDVGAPTNWIFPQVIGTNNAQISLTWPEVPDTTTYKLWGRSASTGLGLLATLPAGTTSWVDNGTVTPTGSPPNTIADIPIRWNKLNSLTVNCYYSERQQRIDDAPYRGV